MAAERPPTRRRGIAILAVTRGGATLGSELLAALGPQAELHLAERWVSLAQVGQPIRGPLADRLTTLFPRVEGLVVILALGATVRLIAPLLSSKQDDPAVVVVDEAGRHAISVVGGHGAGANDLADRVADALGATPIITTASDALGLPSLDLLGRAWGWTLDAQPATLTRAGAAMVNGEPVAVYQDAGERGWADAFPPDWPRLESFDELAAWGGPAVVVTDRALDAQGAEARNRWVVYRPRSLVLGLGSSTGVSAHEISTLADQMLAEAGLCRASLAEITTIDRRLDEPGVQRFAREADLPLRGFSADELAAVAGLPNPSAIVAGHVGTPSVCEAAAVLASRGDLVVPKRKSARATVALARRPAPADDDRLDHGDGVGRLTVIGLGPGPLDGMTVRARRALRDAELVVGYRGYLESLHGAVPARRLRPYELGQETERARAALDQARAGRRVALVSSGDAGVYGMAGLVFELLRADGAAPDLTDAAVPTAPGGEAPRKRPASPTIEIVPGVTAANAAAALLGAPLALDYAVISLSDILVPWATIERRLAGAAAGDFVVVLYNPASGRRRAGLRRARDILLQHRPADTMVGLVREAYRPEQSVSLARLTDLADEAVDMKTIVIIAGSTTRRFGDRLVAPRGYLAT